jgi:hypothetical protein
MKYNSRRWERPQRNFFMEKEVNISLFWDGFKYNFVMILNEEQEYVKSYFDFVNSHENNGRKVFIKRGKYYKYRDPITNEVDSFSYDNFGLADMCDDAETRISFVYGGIVDKKLWDKWFDTDSVILNNTLIEKINKDNDFADYKKKEEKEYNSWDGRYIMEYLCKGKWLTDT